MTDEKASSEDTLKNLNKIWQEYLAKAATDPAAQQNLHTLMQYWTTLAAGGINGYAPLNATPPFHSSYSTPPAAAAPYASSQQLFELASRLSLVEGRIAALEHALHAAPKSGS
jgi:hypothetical protein